MALIQTAEQLGEGILKTSLPSSKAQKRAKVQPSWWGRGEVSPSGRGCSLIICLLKVRFPSLTAQTLCLASKIDLCTSRAQIEVAKVAKTNGQRKLSAGGTCYILTLYPLLLRAMGGHCVPLGLLLSVPPLG